MVMTRTNLVINSHSNHLGTLILQIQPSIQDTHLSIQPSVLLDLKLLAANSQYSKSVIGYEANPIMYKYLEKNLKKIVKYGNQ